MRESIGQSEKNIKMTTRKLLGKDLKRLMRFVAKPILWIFVIIVGLILTMVFLFQSFYRILWWKMVVFKMIALSTLKKYGLDLIKK